MLIHSTEFRIEIKMRFYHIVQVVQTKVMAHTIDGDIKVFKSRGSTTNSSISRSVKSEKVKLFKEEGTLNLRALPRS